MLETDDRLPPGLRRDWPVPRQDVTSPQNGPAAHLQYWAARAALGGIGALPDGLRERAIRGLARLARRVDRHHSGAAREFLQQALGEMPPRELDARVLEAWRHFLRVVIGTEGFERRVDLARIRDHYQVELSPEVSALFASGQGRIVIGSHLGDWEASSAILPWVGCDPLYVIAKPPRNKPLSEHVQRVREARGIRLLARRGAMQHAVAIIEAGGTLGMLLDQRARKRPVLAPFFGRMARCDRSAGVLLRRLHAPAVIGACWLEGPWKWRVVIRDVLQPAELADMTPAEISTRINASFERMILSRPE